MAKIQKQTLKTPKSGSKFIHFKYLSEELKGEVYKALVLPTLLYGYEAWSLREDLFKRLRSFHNRCARSMCRVDLHHTFRHHTTTSSLFRRLNLLDIDSYNHNRLLRWAGHVARMPMSRAPRQLLASWAAHSRPVGSHSIFRVLRRCGQPVVDRLLS